MREHLLTPDRISHMEGLFGATAAREEPVDEAALIRSVRDGDREAGEQLIRMHWDAAQRAAFLITIDRAASEDIAQEAMLSALGSLDRFDDARPSPRGCIASSSTEPWTGCGHARGAARLNWRTRGWPKRKPTPRDRR